jgi:hypothetical protein
MLTLTVRSFHDKISIKKLSLNALKYLTGNPVQVLERVLELSPLGDGQRLLRVAGR